MRFVGIIPARLAASRFPRKPMAMICNMPMVGHCYHRARLALGQENVYVATCDNEISSYIQTINGKSIITSNSHTRATTRTAEALEIIENNHNIQFDVIVMIQGDEPLIQPETILAILNNFNDPSIEVANVMSRIQTLNQFIDKNNVKVVVNKHNDALYFSREPIPSLWKGVEKVPMFMQTGIIAFRREALIRFNNASESIHEQIESVDMNRILDAGEKIRMVLTEDVTLGVDTEEELNIASALIKQDKTLSRYLA